MSLTALPSDVLLACLARVPYADLRNGLPSTCKSLRDAVASSAFRKTREAAGYVEVAVFARERSSNRAKHYLIQASAAYRTVMGPPPGNGGFGDMLRLSSGRGDEVVTIQEYPVFRADAYHPLQNRWRELAPLDCTTRPGPWIHSTGDGVTYGALGSTFMVIGGDRDRTLPFDVYDSSQDAWSRRPDLPFEGAHGGYAKAIEVDGKLWLYAVDGRLQETFVYDPATQTWTLGPRLPHELYSEYGTHWHFTAFELRKRFCLMALFQLTPEHRQYLAFIWDPIQGAWDEAPFPVPPYIAIHSESVDNHLIMSGNVPFPTDNDFGWRNTPHLFVLRPGSRDWGEWSIPESLRSGGMPLTAVRLG